jgi:hypothetical protein
MIAGWFSIEKSSSVCHHVNILSKEIDSIHWIEVDSSIAMPFLYLCRTIANSRNLLWCTSAALIFVFAAQPFIAKPLSKFTDGLNVPDARITGYSSDELNLWYDNIGVEGCKTYILCTHWDFAAIMVIYPLFLGSMLIAVGKSAGLSENLAYIPLVTVAFDIVETYIQREGCVKYPERLTGHRIKMASVACQFKWGFLGSTILAILVVYVRMQLLRKDTSDFNATEKKDR